MRIVIQRVKYAKVSVHGDDVSVIKDGFLVLLGITAADTKNEADVLSDKLVKLRILRDEQGKMNRSVKDIGGEILIVSQFTLYGETKGGNRPSFIRAAKPEKAKPLYEYFVEKVRSFAIAVQTGTFGADMHIATELDGPVTIIMEA